MAWVMLMFFAFSITPKLYLHAIFADHTDVVYQKSADGKTQVAKNGFACDCNNQVATSPFTEHDEPGAFGIITVYSAFIPFFSSQISSTTRLYHTLRGPPAVIS